MPARLASKTAFVTAAAQGMGRAAALAFAAEGARVYATDINERLLAELKAPGIETFALDVRSTEAVNAAAARVGAVDVLFNCAGFVHQGTVLEASDDDWDVAFDLNAKSMLRTIRAFLPGMLERKRGAIVNMASVASHVAGLPRRFIYTASKAAVVGITRSVAADYVAHGIRCNCLCPGTVASPSLEARMRENAGAAGSLEQARADFITRQPMGRLGSPEEIAHLVVYLASDESAFMTGQAVVIDGGLTL